MLVLSSHEFGGSRSPELRCSLSWTQTHGYGRSCYLQSFFHSQRSSLPSGGTVLTASHSASYCMSAPEHFQRRMATILQDLDGVVCLFAITKSQTAYIHPYQSCEGEGRRECAKGINRAYIYASRREDYGSPGFTYTYIYIYIYIYASLAQRVNKKNYSNKITRYTHQRRCLAQIATKGSCMPNLRGIPGKLWRPIASESNNYYLAHAQRMRRSVTDIYIYILLPSALAQGS